MCSSSLEPGQLNHIALPTADPERAARFYCDVLGFREVPRPSFSFDGRWLYRGEVGPMIHLIHDAQHHMDTGPINTRTHHFAMQCNHIERAGNCLESLGIDYVERTLPDHGYRQLFFRDPDGHVIELGEWPDVREMGPPE